MATRSMKEHAARRWLCALLTLATACAAATGCDDDDGSSDASLVAGFAGANVRASACQGSELGDALDVVVLLTSSEGALRADLEATERCIAAAADCPAVLACIDIDAAQPCDVPEFDAGCQGTVQRTCESVDGERGFVREVDCADDLNGNTSCGAVADFTYCHSSDSCATPDGRRCEGDIAIRCTLGVAARADCSLLGLTCIDNGQDVTCGEASSSCSEATCDGSTLVGCGENVVTTRFDCGLIGAGYTCVDDGQTARCGLPADQTECEPGAEVCEGNVARICVGGGWVDHDCGGFLDGSCAIDGGDTRCQLSDWP